MKTKSSVLIIALLISAIAVVLPKPAEATTPQFYLNPNPKICHTGDVARIEVKLSEAPSLNAYQFKLRWDPRMLQYSGIEWGWLGVEDIADFNLNYVVDAEDLGIMGLAWGSSLGDARFDPRCDLYGDDVIDCSDLGILGRHWGHWAPDACKEAKLSLGGYQLNVFAGLLNTQLTQPSATPVVLATVSWKVIAGGATNITFLEHGYWTANAVPISSTTDDGYLYTQEPCADFTWNPDKPRINEVVTFNGSACAPADGDPITGYSWSIDGLSNGTGVTTTGTFSAYSKTPHDVALTVTDSGGHSFTLHKSLTIDRDLGIFCIMPSIEDYQGSEVHSIPVGKIVIVGVRVCNVGSIVEYTNNSRGDFPTTTAMSLYVIHSEGWEEEIFDRVGWRLRNYWYSDDGSNFYQKYDLQPAPQIVAGLSYWAWWDPYGRAPETGLYFKANFSEPVPDDTGPANNELLFGPFNLTAGYEHDIRIDGIWTNEGKPEEGYTTPVPPYGTTFKYFNGGKFNWDRTDPYDPLPPGTIRNVTIALFNVGISNETSVTYHIYADKTEIWNSTIGLNAGEWRSLTFEWNTTGWYVGTYTLSVYVEPVLGENAKWNTWDNNLPTQAIPFFTAYDDWGIYTTFP